LASYKAAEKVTLIVQTTILSDIIKLLDKVVFFMINNQQTLNLSPHMDLYDILIPQDHFLRKINDLVDFSFVYDELKDKYCETNGRNAVHPIVMFKYLLLKFIYNLSDHGLVERSRYDMSFKYFLGLQPSMQVRSRNFENNG